MKDDNEYNFICTCDWRYKDVKPGFVCKECGTIFDPKIHGVPECDDCGYKMIRLGTNWTCQHCGAGSCSSC